MSLALSSRRWYGSESDVACPLTGDCGQTQNPSVVQQTLSDRQLDPSPAAASANQLGTSDTARPSLQASLATPPRTCADGSGGSHAQRIPDSVWSEFTETFRVIELAVSEGLRCSIDAPPPAAFQPELEASADVAPLDRDNHQYSLQLTRRDVSAKRQCEYDVTCAAVARRRDGDDVRYAVSYNRWITVARQPVAVARQPAVYEATNNKQAYDTNAAGDGEAGDYKPKGECLWAGCGGGETTDSWMPAAWPAVKQEQVEERPSCAYQFWRDDADPRQSATRGGARFRCAAPSELSDCRYAAALSYNKVQKLICSVIGLLCLAYKFCTTGEVTY